MGAPLDTDTVPDMVLVDMGVTVLALPAMEVTVLDTVSGRDLLMPGMDVDMEVMVDTAVDMEVMVDTDVATVDTVVEDIPTETMRFPFLPQKQNQIIFRHVSSKVEEEF